jgi:hypothetical protein
MAGLVPAIHAVELRITPESLRSGAAWMAGSSPVMTVVS